MKEEEKQILKIFKRNLNFMEAQKKKLNLEDSVISGVKIKKTTTKRIRRKKRKKMKQKTLSKEAKQAPKYLIYFVCTSNTCRSPMCVGLAREHVKQNNYPFEIRSFGVWSGDGDKASENSVRILRRLGMDISEHRSTSIRNVDFRNEFLKIICMEEWHKHAILEHGYTYNFPALNKNSVILLTEDEVPDPIGGNMAEYVSVFNFLRPHIAKHLDYLAKTLNITVPEKKVETEKTPKIWAEFSEEMKKDLLDKLEDPAFVNNGEEFLTNYMDEHYGFDWSDDNPDDVIEHLFRYLIHTHSFVEQTAHVNNNFTSDLVAGGINTPTTMLSAAEGIQDLKIN